MQGHLLSPKPGDDYILKQSKSKNGDKVCMFLEGRYVGQQKGYIYKCNKAKHFKQHGSKHSKAFLNHIQHSILQSVAKIHQIQQ